MTNLRNRFVEGLNFIPNLKLKIFFFQDGDSLSKLNEFEADSLTGLAGYLIKQG